MFDVSNDEKVRIDDFRTFIHYSRNNNASVNGHQRGLKIFRFVYCYLSRRNSGNEYEFWKEVSRDINSFIHLLLLLLTTKQKCETHSYLKK